MKNYLSSGERLELIAPSGGVVAGVGYVIGADFVIAEHDAAVGETFIGLPCGEFRLAKNTSEAVTQGQHAYWDATNKVVRNASATGRYLIGTVTVAASSSATTCDVRLNGVGVTAIP